MSSPEKEDARETSPPHSTPIEPLLAYGFGSSNGGRQPFVWNRGSGKGTLALANRGTIWQRRTQLHKDQKLVRGSGISKNASQAGAAIGRDGHGDKSADKQGNKWGKIQGHVREMYFEEAFDEEPRPDQEP